MEKVIARSRGLEYRREYYHKNRDKILKGFKEYHKKNRNKILKQHEDLCFLKKKSWVGVIPLETNCECCGKKLYFFGKQKAETIHFDHRNENAPIRQNPANWLRGKGITPERKKLWEESNFGMLCDRCNRFLPLKGRERFIRNMVKYVFGKDKEIK
jgi:hypothetical protein